MQDTPPTDTHKLTHTHTHDTWYGKACVDISPTRTQAVRLPQACKVMRASLLTQGGFPGPLLLSSVCGRYSCNTRLSRVARPVSTSFTVSRPVTTPCWPLTCAAEEPSLCACVCDWSCEVADAGGAGGCVCCVGPNTCMASRRLLPVTRSIKHRDGELVPGKSSCALTYCTLWCAHHSMQVLAKVWCAWQWWWDSVVCVSVLRSVSSCVAHPPPGAAHMSSTRSPG